MSSLTISMFGTPIVFDAPRRRRTRPPRPPPPCRPRRSARACRRGSRRAGSSRMSSVVARSVTAPVGTPPDQKNASIDPSRSACDGLPDAELPRLSMSSSGSSPATSSSRSAITSVPEPGRADGDRLAAHVLDRVDARVGLDDDLGDVRVQRRERAQRLRPSKPRGPRRRRSRSRRARTPCPSRRWRRAPGCRPTPRWSPPSSACRAARRSSGRRARRRTPGRRRRSRRWRSRAGLRRRAGRSASTHARRARPRRRPAPPRGSPAWHCHPRRRAG